MSNFFIRIARPGDEPHIHLAHMRSIREVCVKDHGEEEIKGWGYRELGNRWIEAVQSGDVWVIEKESIIYGLGYIRIFKENEETKAYLHALYLTPEVLGLKLGGQLMILMIEKAKLGGAKEIDLDSTITALSFYKKFGFVDTGPMKRIEIGGHPVTAYPMRLVF